MGNQNLNIETAAGTLGGSLSCILANITLGDVTKTVVLAVIGTVASFFVSLLLKELIKRKI